MRTKETLNKCTKAQQSKEKKSENKNHTDIKTRIFKLKTHTHTHNTYRSPCATCTWAFLSFTHKIFHYKVFSPFWRENFLVGPGRLHRYFPLSPYQPNTLQKVFPLHFFFFFFPPILLKIHSTKHTLSFDEVKIFNPIYSNYLLNNKLKNS